MERPNIKDFFNEDITPRTINNLFLKETELYNYIQALDAYIDELESRPLEAGVILQLAEVNEMIDKMQAKNKELHWTPLEEKWWKQIGYDNALIELKQKLAESKLSK